MTHEDHAKCPESKWEDQTLWDYPTDNRFSDALAIWSGGACNVSGIARSLVKAADAARADGVQPCEDLAVRAIVAQLAWLCKVDAIGGVCSVPYVEAALKAKGGV